jgi:hypothetical protein
MAVVCRQLSIPWSLQLLWQGWLLTCLGCTPFLTSPPQNKSPLRSITNNSDQAILEITTLRWPSTSQVQPDKLWQGIDEQGLSIELRQQLAANGLRIGILTGEDPESLKLLQTEAQAVSVSTTKPVEETPTTIAEIRQETPTTDEDGKLLPETINLDNTESTTSGPNAVVVQPKPLRMMSPHETGLRKHTLYLQPGQPAELLPGGIHEHWPLLIRDQTGVRGRSLQHAQGALQVNAQSRANGALQLTIKPEIQHGEPKPNWIGEDGMIRQEFRKPKELFPELTLDVPLKAGQALVLAPLPERPGSWGQYFLSANEQNKLIPRVLIIRVVREPLDELWK